MNDETTLCRCRDCGAEFSDEDTVPMQIQPGADPVTRVLSTNP